MRQNMVKLREMRAPQNSLITQNINLLYTLTKEEIHGKKS